MKGTKQGMERQLRRFLSLVLCAAMIVTLMPETLAGVFGGAAKAKAAGAIYINDKADGSGSNTPVTDGATGDGWSYDEESNTLTLDGFNGSYIETGVDLTIRLKGINILTMNEGSTNEYGICAYDDSYHVVTFERADSNDESKDDLLKVKADYTDRDAYLLQGDFYVKSGTLDLYGTSANYGVTGADFVTVENDANLKVNVQSGDGQRCIGVDILTEVETATGTITIEASGGNGKAVGNLNLYGSGDIQLTASGNADAVYGAGFNLRKQEGKLKLSGSPWVNNVNCLQLNEKTVLTNYKDAGYYWKYLTYEETGYNSGYTLVDVNGNRIKDALFEFQDNVAFGVAKTEWKLPGMKVGENYSSSQDVWLTPAVYGGKQSYTFSLAEGSSKSFQDLWDTLFLSHNDTKLFLI
ncbi:MAG: hypothetical protein IJ747_00415 [Lachnospiraceae bacterium]|nr:hypothetical protein [Lachnospiraceae bacterium]